MGQASEWNWIKKRLERFDENQKAQVVHLIDALEHGELSGVSRAALILEQGVAANIWENDPVSYDDV